MKSIVLKKNISRRVENGHPWVFANEVNMGMALDTAAKAGEIVDVFTFDKKYIDKRINETNYGCKRGSVGHGRRACVVLYQ